MMNSYNPDQASIHSSPLPPSVSLTCPTTKEPITNLSDAQMYFETTAYDRALSDRGTTLLDASKREDLTSLRPSQSLLVKWFKPLCAAIDAEQKCCQGESFPNFLFANLTPFSNSLRSSPRLSHSRLVWPRPHELRPSPRPPPS